jgi:superfamily II RNA helicase
LDIFNAKELISIFSCFTNISVAEEYRSITPYTENKPVQNILLEIQNKYNKHKDDEIQQRLDTGIEYDLQFDIINYVVEWCETTNDSDCKLVLQNMEREKEIFLGDFVKAILKINNISSELEKVAEYIGNIELLHKLREIPQLTLKYVATNQSLYIHQ